MRVFAAARKIFSIVFIVATLGAAAGNIYLQRDALLADFTGFTFPASFEHAKKNIQWIDEVVKSDIAGKFNFVEAYGYIQVLLGKREFNDFTNVTSNQGGLNLTRFYPPNLALRKYAARLSRMQQAMRAQGGNLLFVSPPSLVVGNYPDYAEGLPYADENPVQDVFLDRLREVGIDCLDSRSYLREVGMPVEQIMFKTDHHWTNQAAFAVFKGVVAKLESAFGISLDPDYFYRDDANYNFRTYKDAFIGFLGRTTGAAYCGFEDFTIIWPRFHREYLTEIIDGAGLNIREGPTEKTLLNTHRLTHREMYASTMYDFYLFGIQPWMRIVNRNNPDGLKVFMVNDSFGPPLAAFLAPLFGEIHMVWPRAEFSKVDIDEYFSANKFDLAIVELYAENISDNGIYFFADPETDDHAELERLGE